MRLVMMQIPFCAGLFFLSGNFVTAQSDPLPVVAPTPGDRAVTEFKVLDDFSLVLLAGEPLVTDPVALCYDADGRAYVAEMNDYPYTDKERHRPMQENPTDQAIGRIRLLTDEDGDGVFDKSSVFADQLSWPTGVVPWKGGVFVTAAPDFWYLKDTDGDGVADIRKKIMTGYRKYNVQSAVNTPVWGLDNRIYIATARNKGVLSSASTEKQLEIPGGRDVRIDPRRPEAFELVSGGIQFGNAFDDWGNRFLCSVGGSVHHAVMPSDAFERNPWLPSRIAVRSCLGPDAPVKLFPITEIEGWRLQRYRDRKFVPRPGYTESRGPNPGDPSRPTSSCGHAVYRGDAYPEQYRGTFFVAEPCYNLVYRLVPNSSGATFVVSKPPTDRATDFIASEDVWFRPITMVNAPDGCLHLADLYRESIEHPWSLPESFHARMDLLLGRDRGRIYRIQPKGYQHRANPRLSQASGAELVALLEHRNAWHRETAQRLLFEREEKSVVPRLESLARSSENPLGRIHALWTLHGLGSLDPDTVKSALSDSSFRVRVNAIRMSATMVLQQEELVAELVRLANDPRPEVRFQVALALGSAGKGHGVARVLSSMARRDLADSWTRLAILSSSVPHADGMLVDLLEDDGFLAEKEAGDFLGSLAYIVGAQNQPGRAGLILSRLIAQGEGPDPLTRSIVVGLADGLRRARSNLASAAGKTSGGDAFLTTLIEEALSVAMDPEASTGDRSEAIRFLHNSSFEDSGEQLAGLLRPAVPETVQSAAATALSLVGGRRAETGEVLLAGWEGYSAPLRTRIVRLLLAREERLGALFKALESGQILSYEVGQAGRDLLVAHKNPAIATRARKLFSENGSREKILVNYRKALSLRGDFERGKLVYESVCMACHKFREKGIIELAPNLAVVSGWEGDRILTNIIDPNREVAPEYNEYIVQTENGETVSGRVIAESGSGITLRLVDNSTRDIARNEIKALKNTGRSFMPEGLEAAISLQGMADLIAYLQSNQISE